MRWVFCGLFALTLASPAAAADFDIPPPGPSANYDVLRGAEPVGPATFTRWSGFYAGGQFGLSNANADFSNSTQALVAYTLRDTTLENRKRLRNGRCSAPPIKAQRLWRVYRL